MSNDKPPGCECCWLRGRAERKPASILARLWRWHTGWCPGWKAYQRWLAEHEQPTQPRTDEA